MQCMILEINKAKRFKDSKSKVTIMCKTLLILASTSCLIKHGRDPLLLDSSLIDASFGATVIVQGFYLLIYLFSDHTNDKTMLIRNTPLIGVYYWMTGILFDSIPQDRFNSDLWSAIMNPVLSVVIILVLVLEVAVRLYIMV